MHSKAFLEFPIAWNLRDFEAILFQTNTVNFLKLLCLCIWIVSASHWCGSRTLKLNFWRGLMSYHPLPVEGSNTSLTCPTWPLCKGRFEPKAHILLCCDLSTAAWLYKPYNTKGGCFSLTVISYSLVQYVELRILDGFFSAIPLICV